MRTLVAAILLVCFAVGAEAQAPYSPPRAPDGHPDFHGVWGTRWTTTLERPPNVSSLIVSLEEGDALHRAAINRFTNTDPLGAEFAWDFLGPVVIRGEVRSSLIIDPADGRLPYTEEGRARRSRMTTPFFGDADIEERSLTERCLLAGSGHAPFLSIPAGNIRQIVQTRDAILFHTETYSQLRIVPLDGRKGPPLPRGGSSSGRWEGDTLVVETAGYEEHDRFRISPGSTFAISPSTRITERFTLIGPDEMLYRYTVEDPVIYSRPWTAESVMRRDPGPVMEFACHEGNYSLSGILAGARAAERRQARR